jgi:alkylation response protein AidB-like acyl-CoA dehydrogenase
MNSHHLRLNSSMLPVRRNVPDSATSHRIAEHRDMTAGETDRIAGYLDAVGGLAPLISAHRDAFDRERRLPDAVFAALAEAGLFRLWLPAALGGPELSPLDFMRVVEAAAALDGSVGWLVGNGAGMSRVGGYLPAALVADWFADPRAFVVSATGAVGTAVPTEGGFRVSGRWPFGSGAHHATHFMGLAATRDDDGKDRPPICCYLPRAQVTVHDTWHVSGLRGTGSCDFEVRDAFVPADRTHPFIALSPTQPGLVYRMPPLSVFAWTVSVVPLGIASGAIRSFVALASRRSRQGSGAMLRDRETVQATVGRAEALRRAGRAFLAEAMTELQVATDAGGDRLERARTMFRVACAHAAEAALGITDMLAADAGSAAIFESCPLERAVRDVQAAVKHIAMSPSSYALAGRLSLGLDAGTARF